MTASADGPSPFTSIPAAAVDSLFGPPLETIMATRSFKKHKVLPHPKRASYSSLASTSTTRRPSSKYDLVIDTSQPGSAIPGMDDSPTTSPRALKHQPRRIGSGPPDLPPTPPAHSRTSSSSHSVSSSTRPHIETPQSSAEDVKIMQPTTPIAQMSPPTPDVTPPRAMAHRRVKAMRPAMNDRIPSKATTDSRTESFKTARENPSESELEEVDEDGNSTQRPAAPSARTSQTTVRHIPGDARRKSVGLGLGLESSPENSVTSRSKGEFVSFDGEWGSPSEEVEQEWDDNLNRNVVVRKRRQPAHPNGRTEVIENDMITPTNATKALRAVTLPGRILAYSSPQSIPERSRPVIFDQRSVSNSSGKTDPRRFSGMSVKSTAETVVEAILVDNTPRRQKTLRHVRKQFTLRDSGSDISPPSTAPTSIQLEEGTRRSRPKARVKQEHGRHQSTASTATYNSISSNKARREIWKNGGIPVVIVPDRRSSTKSNSREPSLRSTSSRRSKRSQSLSSAPLSQISRTKDLTPYFERPTRRSRAQSESDGSTPGDQRTMDYPPIVPRRTSSLSAPTSRNGSRRSSLTTDSLKAHDAIQIQQALKQAQNQPSPRDQLERTFPDVRLERVPSVVSRDSVEEAEKVNVVAELDRLAVDRHGDLLLGRRTSLQNTPFSMASMETSTSHHSNAEVSEALAVNIYPHQNTSVLMVDHSRKPSDCSDGSPKAQSESSQDTIEPPKRPALERPTIKTTDHDAAVPVTPPQGSKAMEDVDSPLRNPRAPPMPPAINFIPATPSGLTPAQDKDKNMGNYFGEVTQKPKRSMSLVRRAFSLRRHTEYGPSASRSPGIITRTLSLTRNMRKDPGERYPRGKGKASDTPPHPRPGDEPREEGKLHPLWRPASYYDGDDQDFVYDQDEDFETLNYPPIDNRPAPPRRTLSDKMKRTFAILPIRDLDEYPATSDQGPERRTVRRTASGNLRVVKHRASLESVPRHSPNDGRPYTAPEQRNRRFWRATTMPHIGSAGGPSSSQIDGGKWARLFPSLAGGGKVISDFGDGGLQTLTRRLSLSERRREKRSAELRQKISGPREVRDGVGDVIRRNSYRDAFTQAQCDPEPV